jgi:hypothetical protein
MPCRRVGPRWHATEREPRTIDRVESVIAPRRRSSRDRQSLAPADRRDERRARSRSCRARSTSKAISVRTRSGVWRGGEVGLVAVETG